jgi:hypothetical protein
MLKNLFKATILNIYSHDNTPLNKGGIKGGVVLFQNRLDGLAEGL